MFDFIEAFYCNYFGPVGQFFDHMNNYILTIGGLYAFLEFVYIPLIHPLRQLFSRQGLSLLEASKVAWICRWDTYLYVRLYIESACIESGGHHQSVGWWKRLRYRFRNRVKAYRGDKFRQQGRQLSPIEVETCSDLISEEVQKSISRYFNFLRGRLYSEDCPEERGRTGADVRMVQKCRKSVSRYFDKLWKQRYSKWYVDDQKKSPGFLSEISIKEGFLAPMAVIRGLNDRFEQNWKHILNNYNATLEDNAPGEVVAEELYFSFNWLMWGPSYRIQCEEPGLSRIMLYGYGDEANSVNILAKTFEVETAQGKRGDQELDLFTDKPGCFGIYGRITGRLVDSYQYSRLNRETIEKHSLPFFERISQETLSTPFMLEIKSIRPSDVGKGNRIPFFSAYLWIMFRIDDVQPFSPARSVTFFEHANLPDSGNYKFLADCLIDKAFNYFRKISHHLELRHRKYRYCLSMNSYIETLFRKRLEGYQGQGQDDFAVWTGEHLAPDSAVDIATVLDAFDSYFSESSVRELYDTEDDRLAVGEFYIRKYYPVFGQQAGHHTLDGLMAKLSEGARTFRLFAEFDRQGKILGMVSACSRADWHCGIVEVVMSEDNHTGVGVRLTGAARWWIEHEVGGWGKDGQDYILLHIPSFSRWNSSTIRLQADAEFYPLDFRVAGFDHEVWLMDRVSSGPKQAEMMQVIEKWQCKSHEEEPPVPPASTSV